MGGFPLFSFLMYFSSITLVCYAHVFSCTQAINGIEYGSPLAITVHHSTAYVLDTSPPLLNDVIFSEYDITTNQLVFSYTARYVGWAYSKWLVCTSM